MIHRVKTVTWEVRSHGHRTTISEKGFVEQPWNFDWDKIGKVIVKRLVWHLEDVLKCMKQIEKEKEKKKAYEESIKDLGELLAGNEEKA